MGQHHSNSGVRVYTANGNNLTEHLKDKWIASERYRYRLVSTDCRHTVNMGLTIAHHHVQLAA